MSRYRSKAVRRRRIRGASYRLSRKRKPSGLKARAVGRGQFSFQLGLSRGLEDGFNKGRQDGIHSALQNTLLPSALMIVPILDLPSLEILLLQPFRALRQQGLYNYRVRTEQQPIEQELEQVSKVIFLRTVEPSSLEKLEQAKAAGKQTIYCVDDNFLAIPQVEGVFQYYTDPARRDTFVQMMRRADVVQLYSPFFAEYTKLHFNPNVLVFPASVDFAWLDQVQRPGKPGEPVVIGYQGTHKEEDFVPVVPAIRRIAAEYGSRVRFEFNGFVPAALTGVSSVSSSPYDFNYRSFMHKMKQAGWDIGLAPLADTMFNKCKTNNKFREYAACGIAGIFSQAPVYSDWVAHGQTGLLTEHTAEGWYMAMKQLIDDSLLREAIRRQGEAYSRSQFSIERSVACWREQLLQV